MVNPPLLDALLAALAALPSVRVVTLFGSRARGAGDARSDLDLQIITSQPRRFHDASWARDLPYPLIAYAHRPASGGVTKFTAMWTGGEADMVALPLRRLQLARLLVACGAHRRSRRIAGGLEELARILRPGHRVLLGDDGWKRFLVRVVAEVPEPRLGADRVRRLGECAYVDYVSLRHKVARGELVAAQRVLHVNLVETNLRLMHEQRLLAGRASFRDGRRVEQLLTPGELAAVRTEARLSPGELLAAAEAALATTRRLVHELGGQEPGWPRD